MKQEREKIEADWNALDPLRRAQLRDRWEEKALEWDQGLRNDSVRRIHYDKRVAATIAWLQTFGLFQGDCDVADIGCGPGRFVAEFAKKSRYVAGFDISTKMAECGKAFSEEQGIKNTEFFVGDFAKLDVNHCGWSKRFDLAFSSITPAIKGKDGLENLIAISRAWCFNSCFVNFYNELHDRIMHDLYGLPPRREKTSHSNWFKQLFDVLWMRGYHPYIHYYKEHRDECRYVDRAFAEDNAQFLLSEEATEKEVARILDYLKTMADKDGNVSFASECWYGWILWNVNDRVDREK